MYNGWITFVQVIGYFRSRSMSSEGLDQLSGYKARLAQRFRKDGPSVEAKIGMKRRKQISSEGGAVARTLEMRMLKDPPKKLKDLMVYFGIQKQRSKQNSPKKYLK